MPQKTINIGIILFEAQYENTGIGNYENALATELAILAPSLRKQYGIEFWYFVHECMVGQWGQEVHYIQMDKKAFRKLNFWATSWYYRKKYPKFDLIHWTHQNSRLTRPISPYTLCTVHDVNFFHQKIANRFQRFRKIHRIMKRIKPASHIAFISEFSSNDVKAHLTIQQPSRVVYNGATDSSKMAPQEASNLNLSQPYFFCICRLKEGKGQHLLIEMMKHMPENFRLMLAGRGHADYVNRITSLIEELKLSDRVSILGSVSAEEKADLYRNCEALLFPSLSEGFGLPVVEAQYFGKPVVCSNLTSLPEVGGQAVYYFDTLDPKRMAEVTLKSLEDFHKNEEARKKCILQNAARFSWKKSAEAYVQYYLDILGITPSQNQ